MQSPSSHLRTVIFTATMIKCYTSQSFLFVVLVEEYLPLMVLPFPPYQVTYSYNLFISTTNPSVSGRQGTQTSYFNLSLLTNQNVQIARVHLEFGDTWWRTGGEVKEKLASGVGSQYSHATSKRGLSSITQADAHTSAAGSRLNWRPHRFKWTRPFRGKTKSGFCACAITFRRNYTRS